MVSRLPTITARDEHEAAGVQTAGEHDAWTWTYAAQSPTNTEDSRTDNEAARDVEPVGKLEGNSQKRLGDAGGRRRMPAQQQ